METERLIIRRLQEADWREMRRIFLDFQQSEYAVYDMPLPTEEAEVKALTKRFAESGGFYAVVRREMGDMIGYVCVHPEGESYDLGYCFHSACHGMGYAAESVTALMDYLAAECGAVCFTAGTALDNVPSCRLLEKLGFVCTATETVSFDRKFSFQGGRFVLQRNK